MSSDRLRRLLFALPLLAAACSPMLYIPSPADTSAGASLEDLRRGREIYVARCGSCHSLLLPDRFSKEEWEREVAEMGKRAALTNEERAAVLAYLLRGR